MGISQAVNAVTRWRNREAALLKQLQTRKLVQKDGSVTTEQYFVMSAVKRGSLDHPGISHFFPDGFDFDGLVEAAETNTLSAEQVSAIEQAWLQEREQAETDLYYLAKYLLGLDLLESFVCYEHKMYQSPKPDPCPVCHQVMGPCPGLPDENGNIESCHKTICDFFVHKDPRKELWEQDTRKRRLLMMSRGIFKSSIDQADCVQWILAFPDIRIGVMSAAEELAGAFITQTKKHFEVLDVDAPTHFQYLFPEHSFATGRIEAEGWFESPGRTPAGKKQKEPSMHAISLKKHTAGWHYDIIKYDDCVDNSNSGGNSNAESRLAIYAQMRDAFALGTPSGYHDYIGTPWADDDAYTILQEKQKSGLYKLIVPCWRLKPSGANKLEEDRVESDYWYLLPFDSQGRQQLTFAFLKDAQNDQQFFACQYLCNPLLAKQTHFTEQHVRGHVINPTKLPQSMYETVQVWDFAYSSASGRDYTVGLTALIERESGKLYVVDMLRGRFTKYELAKTVAEFAIKWRPKVVAIEGSNGAAWLETDIRTELTALGWFSAVLDFFKIDNKPSAKAIRIEMLEGMFVHDRLWFSSNIDEAIIAQIVKELMRFKPGAKRKDDAADTLGHLVARFAPNQAQIQKAQWERTMTPGTPENRAWEILREKMLHDRIYNGPGPIPDAPPPPPEEPPQLPITEFDGQPVFTDFDSYLYGR